METEPTATPTKAEVIDRIERSYAAVEATIARMSPAQLTEARDADGWSAKDHIAHLAAWRRALAALLAGGDMAAAMGVTPGLSLDETNAEVYARARNLPLSAALDGLRRAHEQVLATLAPLSIAALSLPYSQYQPGDRPDGGDPVYAWIVGDTYEHDEEHLPAIASLANGA